MSPTEKSIALLKKLIATPSFSKEETGSAALIRAFLEEEKITFKTSDNNVWAYNKHYSPDRPSILLNSHHDTVRPNAGYTKDPFQPEEQEGKLYGLGSNDAGGALVSLLATFMTFYATENLKYNLVFAATAEEEISGKKGIASILHQLGSIDFAIVGEPTLMQMAVSEKGLMVLDCKAKGKAGHAARQEGENAIYKAMKDISWFETYRFPIESPTLGPIHLSVTQVNAGSQHNVVPDTCDFVVDVRTTDAYSNETTLAIIKENTRSIVEARSTRLQPSSIDEQHPIVQAGLSLGMSKYGSPTLSDQALMPFTSLKLGPGDSARSHTADEYIYLREIKEGIRIYKELLSLLIIA